MRRNETLAQPSQAPLRERIVIFLPSILTLKFFMNVTLNSFQQSFLFACLFLLGTLGLSAQSVVLGYGLKPADFGADRLPNGDLLLTSVDNAPSGSSVVWAQVDTSGTVVQAQTVDFAQFLQINARAVLADGRAIVGGLIDLGTHVSPFTLAHGGVTQGNAHAFDTQNLGEFLGLVPLPDSGYIGLGYRNTPDFRYLAAAVRVDKAGDTLWTRAYDLSGIFVWNAGVARPDGSFLVVGYLGDLNSDRGDLVIASMAKGGNLHWIKRYQSSRTITVSNMAQGSDGHFYLSVLGTDTLTGKAQPGMVSVDSLGNIRWGKVLSGYQDAAPMGVAFGRTQAPVVYGSYKSSVQGNDVGFLATFDNAGALQSSTGYGSQGSSTVKAVFLQAGAKPTVVMADAAEPLAAQLLHTNVLGELDPGSCGVAQPNFLAVPLAFVSRVVSPVQTHGFGSSWHAGAEVVSVIPTGIVCNMTSIAGPAPSMAAQIVPHPLRSTSRLLVEGLSMSDACQLVVTDMQGRQVDIQAAALGDGFQLSRAGLANGLYSYQVLQAGQRIASGKLWIAD